MNKNLDNDVINGNIVKSNLYNIDNIIIFKI